MNTFDPYFERIREYESSLKDHGGDIRSWFAEPDNTKPKGQRSSPLILKENTAVELGGPLTANSRFMLRTANASLVSHRKVTLIGPDIAQIRNGVYPFGQVIMVAGPSLNGQNRLKVERTLSVAEQIPGYMARSTGGKIWSRISLEALDSGFSLRSLGTSIVAHLAAALSDILTAVELLFVTSSVADVHEMEKIGAQVRKLDHDLRRQRLTKTGESEYQCEAEISCEVCPDNVVCNEIRQILTIRKKGKRTT
jgi:CO dehydrogenase/acetyl-CoA synthase beta subunit